MNRLLVVDLHHLGDAVLALPFVAAASARHEVWVCCRPPALEVFSWLVPRSRCLAWNPPWHEDSRGRSLPDALRAGRQFASRELRPRGFDCAVCAWADPRVHWLLRHARIPRRIGFPASARNFYAADFPPRRRSLRLGLLAQTLLAISSCQPLLTTRVDKRQRHQHHLESWRQLAAAAGLPAPATNLRQPLAARTPALALPDATATTLAIAPCARLPSKTWPLDRFQSVAALVRTAHPGLEPRWLLAPDCPHELPPTAATRRPASLAALYREIGGCRALLCNDSLPTHLATIAGVPALAVFRTGNPAWFAPRAAHSAAAFKPLDSPRPVADSDGNPAYVDTTGPPPHEVAGQLSKLLACGPDSA